MQLITVLPLASIARSVPSLFTGSGAFAKMILLVLFVISVISWAIILDRTRLYLRLRAKGTALRAALSAHGFAGCMANLEKFLPSVEGSVLMEARQYLLGHEAAERDGRLVVDNHAAEEVERTKLRDAPSWRSPRWNATSSSSRRLQVSRRFWGSSAPYGES
jgi:hypothetical protein